MRDIELDDESRRAFVQYRMNRAEETVKEAVLLAGSNYYNAAINRLYYSCYYASVALLLQNRISSQTHSGVKAMIGLHFITTGKMPVSVGKTLSTLFEKRQSGDYDDFIMCDNEMFQELLPKAEEYIAHVKKLLKE